MMPDLKSREREMREERRSLKVARIEEHIRTAAEHIDNYFTYRIPDDRTDALAEAEFELDCAMSDIKVLKQKVVLVQAQRRIAARMARKP